MSSIISDIFYGSKQNLLDNYLIHRFDKEPSLSQQQLQQRTALYSSTLHFTITIPMGSHNQQRCYSIKIQLGKKIEEVIAELGGKKHKSEIVVEMTDLQNVDLSKYSNIKITISEGKYKDRIFGYIPIQIIKSMMAQQCSQKTITLPVKGKRSFGFSNIKCHIKADFSQNILNSNILGSIDKDNSELSHLQFKSRENQIEEISGIHEHSQHLELQARNYGIGIKREAQKPNKKYRNDSESNILEKYSYNSKNQKKMKYTTQFIKEILPVPAIFSNIKSNKVIYQQQQIKLSFNQVTFNLGQEVRLRNITQQGLNIDIYADQSKIGTVHLNVLFLTMTDFKGELPIYDQNKQFVGTILVYSPTMSIGFDKINWRQTKFANPQTIKKQESQFEMLTHNNKQFNSLIVISIKKIVMTNLSKELINQSLDNANQLKVELFDFVKMQACGRLQLIVKINHQNFRFNDISLRYIIDNDQAQVVQLRSKQGFSLISWQQIKRDHNVLQMELYSNHRLLCYSKSTFRPENQANHQFTAAKTQFGYCQSSTYFRHIQLIVPQDYFQTSRLSQITGIIQQMVDGQLKLLDLSDVTIKLIMNTNKKIAYVQVKKLFNLIHSHFSQYLQFQNTKINTVLGEQSLNDRLIISINTKLLRQFALLDLKNSSSIEYQEFLKVVQFFTKQTVSEAQQSCEKLMKNCIRDAEGRVLYPLFVAGLYLYHQPILIPGQHPLISNNYSRQNFKIIDDEPKAQENKQVIVKSQQKHFVQSIQFRNLHLLNLGKIPNIMLSISNKTHYSNANPEFIVQKEINITEPIKIYHKNIAQDNIHLLAELVPLKRRSLYELDQSGKVTAKIIWDN